TVIASEADNAAALSHADAGNERYSIQRLLGRGGMAVVYEAVERNDTTRRVALKQLQTLSDPLKQQRNLELFEREFHTLSQLAHPRIVRVFDFGIDAGGAYYAMELLEGGDLQELAPVPWRRACSIARDVCSALSLLHSRRLVHRDVSPRNVRCLNDGPAKLIDFGAMAPAGPTKLIVGTPPCCAPESVHLQALDGRTDLFSLGATLYFMLVGQHAFPARNFAALSDAWQTGFARPSQVVADIPAELDALVSDLLSLEPDARPASAAEVMERLSAIDGEAASEQLMAARAYLATPVLVGRDEPLARVRRRLQRAPSARSRSVVIEGQAGVGRTRFLDACLLEATLAGQVVVRTDADDAANGEYGVLRAAAQQLLTQVPQLARETAAPLLATLVRVVPELAPEPCAPLPANDVPLPRATIQRALRQWLTALSQRKPFVLAVDGFHRIDEPSAALIALLEKDGKDHSLCLLVTVESGATWTAEGTRRLLSPLTTLRLDALALRDTEKLLSSVFGAVPHIELLANSLQKLCAGSPRDTLLLAQHLIDRGVVRYDAGTWTLPFEIDASDLPASLSDALSSRIANLSDDARELARALAVCPDLAFTFEECGQLCVGGRNLMARVALVEELVRAEIAKRLGDGVAMSQRSWVPLLCADLSSEQRVQIERRFAVLFERRGDQAVRAAQHWFRAAEPGRALDLLALHSEQSQEVTARGAEIFQRYLTALPEGWFETFQEGLRQCDLLTRPPRYKYALLGRLVGIMALLCTHDEALFSEIFVFLRRDSGYDAWAALDPALDPQQRLMTALTQAQARYDALPESERVLDVITAIRALARAMVSASSPIAMAMDMAALRRLPQLTPFVPLSPALDATNRLLQGIEARYSGRLPLARRLFIEVLEMTERSDRAGFDESHAEYLKAGMINTLGVGDATLGSPTSWLWADRLAGAPAFELNAVVIRMLSSLFQGDIYGADQHKRAAERLRVENGTRQFTEGSHLLPELQAHALSGDITRVRQLSEEVAPLAKRFPQWVPILRYATAEYHRMTRDYKRARSELEKVLAAVAVGTHLIWPHAA
ncbi:MAG: hypothetical protein RL701_5307, partial [Pseudomonadota bacterium]